MKTINKLRLLGFPDGILSSFTNYLTTDALYDAIVGCIMFLMIKSDADALQFCDVMDNLVDTKSSITYIEILRNGKYI